MADTKCTAAVPSWTAGYSAPNSFAAASSGTVTFVTPTLDKVATSGPVIIEDVAKWRVVRLALANAPFEEVTAESDPDTNVITVTIGCQTHSLERWRRIGPRLIRRNGYESSAKQLTAALVMVLNRFEAEFKKRER